MFDLFTHVFYGWVPERLYKIFGVGLSVNWANTEAQATYRLSLLNYIMYIVFDTFNDNFDGFEFDGEQFMSTSSQTAS